MLRILESVRGMWQNKHQIFAENQKMLSINQLNAQIKLTEMWRVSIVSNYPLEIKKLAIPKYGTATRGMTQANLI
jgi:hypothetical protein